MQRLALVTLLFVAACELSDVCPQSLCAETLTIGVISAYGQALSDFRGSIDADGTLYEFQCPGSATRDIRCTIGAVQLLRTPERVIIELESLDGLTSARLETNPNYGDVEATEDECNTECRGTRIAIKLQ